MRSGRAVKACDAESGVKAVRTRGEGRRKEHARLIKELVRLLASASGGVSEGLSGKRREGDFVSLFFAALARRVVRGFASAGVWCSVWTSRAEMRGGHGDISATSSGFVQRGRTVSRSGGDEEGGERDPPEPLYHFYIRVPPSKLAREAEKGSRNWNECDRCSGQNKLGVGVCLPPSLQTAGTDATTLHPHSDSDEPPSAESSCSASLKYPAVCGFGPAEHRVLVDIPNIVFPFN
ncbi:hypothetical protein R3P38DRAFT_2810469 [Favolaschia claudopus]|uniref:Uncharacterized protein n=1 Tax=Favolaschia claudopus TaxID=2862362 RepID=A0AAV9ZB91_9AGAR